MSVPSSIAALTQPPANIYAFLDETAAGLGALYGIEAGEEYLATAPAILRTSIGHPTVRFFAAMDSYRNARAVLMAVLKPPIAHIVYLHVLDGHIGSGIEAALLDHALRSLDVEPLEGIVSEYLAFQPQDVADTYRAHGFTPEERTLMLAPLDAPALAAPPLPASIPFGAGDWEDAAAVLVAAYRKHPGRRLHLEVRDPFQAIAFLRTTEGGGYGRFEPGYARLHRAPGMTTPDGMIIGSRVAPGVGFVLHVAVRPEAQGQGIGTRLVRDLADAFRQAGLHRVGLGVTRDNPARALYERLGFQSKRDLTAWYKWRSN